jgi:hypothetical protein
MTLTKEQKERLQAEIVEEIFREQKEYFDFINSCVWHVVENWDEKTLVESAKEMEVGK